MIDVQGLSFTYPGESSPAIRDLTFDISEGEIFGFLGPSGAGKSTTQNVLTGLLRGWRGAAQVLGRSIDAWGAELYRTIGVSFETPNHYLKLTARENLEYFRDLYEGDAVPVEEALTWLDLQNDIDKRVGAFSKGMKNRLNLARSLLHQPRLWFLDEPTAGLDPVNAVRVRDLVKKRQGEGVTVFLTTHDMHTAETLCDRVAFIVDGRLAIVDSPSALRRRFGRREVAVRYRGGSDGAELESHFPLDDLAENVDFLAALRGHELISIHSQEASLEDVFVEVTGRTLQ